MVQASSKMADLRASLGIIFIMVILLVAAATAQERLPRTVDVHLWLCHADDAPQP